VRLDEASCERLLAAADHAVLATISADGSPDIVPVCHVASGGRLAIGTDTVKPKSTTTLQRVANLERDARATLLCEHWDSGDWTKLWWVRARLVLVDEPLTSPFVSALREKYPQYRGHAFADVLVFDVRNLSGWSARPL
jgi:PPOX class probable F420-dependent enzyme